ncbi:nucleotidyltransferase family protein [Vasconcelosia minhoensis]|nr:nucleotidyltransferase domain-containing protein [Romeria gracilis]
MMPLVRLNVSRNLVENFCRRWKVSELSLFGSILRDDFQTHSDVDILAAFAPEAAWDLLDLVNMQQELEGIFNRKVDLLEKRAIESSDNWIRRQEILSSAQVIYSQAHELAG